MTPAPAAPAAPRKVESRDPATGEVWRSYATANASAVRAAMDAARAAQSIWGAESLRHRAQAVERFRRLLFERRAEVAGVVMRENGKPAAEALTTEVMVTLDLARFFARRAPHVLADRHFTPFNIAMWRKRVTVRHEPLGVVGVISPWNYPFMLAAGLLLPAVAAGNGVLFKPSEFSPTTGVLLGEILNASGIPPGLVQVLTGDGGTGAAVIEAGVDKVFFVGSAATGRKVAQECGAPHAVRARTGRQRSLDRARRRRSRQRGERHRLGALQQRGADLHRGQADPRGERGTDAFVEKLAARVRALHVGPGASLDTDVGPMIRPSQRAALQRQLNNALARGAAIAAQGGTAAGGDFMAPTLLVNVAPGMQVLREETFGPLLPVVRVRDADEAVRIANASRYGLSASVWGRDRAHAERVARSLEAGTVVVNDSIVAAGIAEVPHGGVKESGFGSSRHRGTARMHADEDRDRGPDRGMAAALVVRVQRRVRRGSRRVPPILAREASATDSAGCGGQ